MAASPNLQRKLQQSLGSEAAADLLVRMESMDAQHAEFTEFRRETQAGFARVEERFGKVDERLGRLEGRMDAMKANIDGRMDAMKANIDGRLDTLQATMDGRLATMHASMGTMQASMGTMQANMERLIEKGLRDQTRFFFLAWSVLLAAIIGLYARI